MAADDYGHDHSLCRDAQTVILREAADAWGDGPASRRDALIASIREEADSIGMNYPQVADLLHQAARALARLG